MSRLKKSPLARSQDEGEWLNELLSDVVQGASVVSRFPEICCFDQNNRFVRANCEFDIEGASSGGNTLGRSLAFDGQSSGTVCGKQRLERDVQPPSYVNCIKAKARSAIWQHHNWIKDNFLRLICVWVAAKKEHAVFRNPFPFMAEILRQPFALAGILRHGFAPAVRGTTQDSGVGLGRHASARLVLNAAQEGAEFGAAKTLAGQSADRSGAFLRSLEGLLLRALRRLRQARRARCNGNRTRRGSGADAAG